MLNYSTFDFYFKFLYTELKKGGLKMKKNPKKEDAKSSIVTTIVFGFVFLLLGIISYRTFYEYIGQTICHNVVAFFLLCIWFIPATIATILIVFKTRNLIKTDNATTVIKILAYSIMAVYFCSVVVLVLLQMGYQDTILKVLYFREPVSCILW